MGKSAPFQIAGKLRYTPTDNGFKQIQIAYLAVISNLDKLVQPFSATFANQAPRVCYATLATLTSDNFNNRDYI